MQRLVTIKNNAVAEDFTDTADKEFALSAGANWQECEKGFDNNWYLIGFAPVQPEPTYAEQRAQAYPEITEQLDKFYHDIDSGMFGDGARTSEFYLARKAVKEEFPKPESDSPSTEEV